MRAAVPVVLDTNVLLSLFVFADSRFAPLRGRLETGTWRALADGRGLHEFRRVLTYPMFALDALTQERTYAVYADLIEAVTPAAAALPLPQCADGEDQKFLEVARDGKAQWLITADKALLKLARRRKLAHLFGIVTPEVALAL